MGLRRVSPTVVSCAVPVETALARLREVGYFPVAEGVPARPSPRGTAAARAQRTPEPRTVHPSPGRLDEGVLASRLLATPSTAVPEPTTWPLRELRALAPQLPLGQLALLSSALEQGGRVAITYRAASGAVTQRVIRDPELIGAVVEAWCELREDERVFSVSGMLSVAPAP